MSQWIASILALALMAPGSASAADPTNDPEIEQQIYQVALGSFAGSPGLCVRQKPEDFAPTIAADGMRESLIEGTDWIGAGKDKAALRLIQGDWRSLISNLRRPIVGHYIPPESLSPEMSLVDHDRSCARTLVVSAPAFASQTVFIDVNDICALCGSGQTLALRHVGKRWKIVASVTRWMS
ncbi:hypothetical protein QH494_15265 [Sphingomonas sp. AR_OL41]|uniref:hypothetical protein n=1 Tax=Sphingomonas sp. AR_OL41 TaxID=3042729 RepID=UPI00247FAE34|nr:hypothetical protein [Sphingomonas sp. AR_OL41]MDH7973549.1 hypothetical protein [Sphingomonas sp. AR_OL41]